MKKVFVYLAINGENCEASDVVSVHRDEKNAIASALAQPTCFGGGWKQSPADKDEGRNYWTNGCDYVTVQKHEVIE